MNAVHRFDGFRLVITLIGNSVTRRRQNASATPENTRYLRPHRVWSTPPTPDPPMEWEDVLCNFLVDLPIEALPRLRCVSKACAKVCFYDARKTQSACMRLVNDWFAEYCKQYPYSGYVMHVSKSLMQELLDGMAYRLEDYAICGEPLERNLDELAVHGSESWINENEVCTCYACHKAFRRLEAETSCPECQSAP